MASPAPSPSPTPPPPPAQSASPHHSHQHSTKAGALVSAAKSTLSEQTARLSLKHTTDLDLLDDLRLYLKTRCSIERDYAQALAKLNSAHSKRSSSLLTFVTAEDDISDVKTMYTGWKCYQEEMEKHAKARVTVFETFGTACDQLKNIRTHKVQVAKKCLDTHLKKMQEEVIASVMEIDKTRKLYFEEEHLARQARDKEEKIKKKKTGIFSSFANLQTKKERTSAHREASDIQSTQARNDYIMALGAGNAHLQHFYEQDLPNLSVAIDDAALDKCRGFILNLLQTERDMINSWSEVVDRSTDQMQRTSADHTNAVVLRDPNSTSITETLLYEYQPCDNDSCDFISLDHNADIALRNEAQKWFTWFSKDCRNLNRLCAQLVRVQAMQLEGHKTIEVTGSGQVDIETRIDEIRQQIRKCEISKLKAKARLQLIKESGAEVDDYDAFENQATMEIKQQSLDVDLNIGSLSRTSSMRSNMGSDSRSPVPRAEPEPIAVAQTRPESSSSAEQLDSPDREVLQLGSSVECTSPAPGSAALSSTTAAGGWDAYDPTAVAWDDEPPATANNDLEQQAEPGLTNDYDNINQSVDDTTDADGSYAQVTTDGFSLIGKTCYVLYSYTGGGEDELTIMEQEMVSVIEASDKDWVRAQNSQGLHGYVPAAYLQAMHQETDHMPVAAQSSVNTCHSFEDSECFDQKNVSSSYEMPQVTHSPLEISTSVDSYSQPMPPPPPPESMAEYVRAVYSYEATNPEEISFEAGEMIRIVDNSTDDGWWTGESKDGHVGHFPSMLVVGLNEEEDEEEEESEEDEDEEADESYSQPSSMPPPDLSLPPVAPPPLSTSAESANTVDEGGGECIAGPAPPPPTFAPPPKPMSLMAPQTVVIIQPTPEIESRPVEDFADGGDDSVDRCAHSPTEDSDSVVVTGGEHCKSNGEAESSVTLSMAIAAEEVSNTLTQQALDESMRELSRRTSASSSHEGSVYGGDTTTSAMQSNPQPNGDVVHSNGNGLTNAVHEEGDEDCK